MTRPTETIDSNWIGNVMSYNHSYAGLKMFKFTDHYFCNCNGLILDATANATHADTSTIVAFELEKLPAHEAAPYNGQGGYVYGVSNVSAHFIPKTDLDLAQGRWVVVRLGSDRLVSDHGNEAFAQFLLTRRARTTRSETENFSMISGRTSHRV